MKLKFLINAFLLNLILSSSAVYAQVIQRYYMLPSKQEILDARTGLIWMRCPMGYKYNNSLNNCSLNGTPIEVTFKDAITYSKSTVNIPPASLSYSAWRIPNAKELASLIDTNYYIKKGTGVMPRYVHPIFHEVPDGTYWSSTPLEDPIAKFTQPVFGVVAVVDFINGYSYPATHLPYGPVSSPMIAKFNVRLVRDANSEIETIIPGFIKK